MLKTTTKSQGSQNFIIIEINKYALLPLTNNHEYDN